MNLEEVRWSASAVRGRGALGAEAEQGPAGEEELMLGQVLCVCPVASAPPFPLTA